MNEYFRPTTPNGEDREPASSEAHADTTPEPPADPGHAMTIMDLFDARMG